MSRSNLHRSNHLCKWRMEHSLHAMCGPAGTTHDIQSTWAQVNATVMHIYDTSYMRSLLRNPFRHSLPNDTPTPNHTWHDGVIPTTPPAIYCPLTELATPSPRWDYLCSTMCMHYACIATLHLFTVLHSQNHTSLPAYPPIGAATVPSFFGALSWTSRWTQRAWGPSC